MSDSIGKSITDFNMDFEGEIKSKKKSPEQIKKIQNDIDKTIKTRKQFYNKVSDVNKKVKDGKMSPLDGFEEKQKLYKIIKGYNNIIVSQKNELNTGDDGTIIVKGFKDQYLIQKSVLRKQKNPALYIAKKELKAVNNAIKHAQIDMLHEGTVKGLKKLRDKILNSVKLLKLQDEEQDEGDYDDLLDDDQEDEEGYIVTYVATNKYIILF